MQATANDPDDDVGRPELHKQDKWKRQPENTDRTQWEEQNREKYLTTWTSPDGKTSR